jgi:hypothetical protein
MKLAKSYGASFVYQLSELGQLQELLNIFSEGLDRAL